MGILSDLVVAGEGDANLVCHTLNPATTFGGIDIKGIDSTKFESLDQILTGRTRDQSSALFNPLVCASDDGPWVFRIPEDLVVRLGTLSASEQVETAEIWLQTEEEFKFEIWDPDAVKQYLASICTLARRAGASQQALYLWMSL